MDMSPFGKSESQSLPSRKNLDKTRVQPHWYDGGGLKLVHLRHEVLLTASKLSEAKNVSGELDE